jgi:pimeloyl-ACP methyl ester carboxylesterase
VKLPALTDAYLGRLQSVAAATYPDFIATMRRVHARLERQPVTATFKDSAGQDITLVLGPTDVRAVATSLTSDPARSRLLPALYTMMDQGDFTRTASLAWDRMRKPGAIVFKGMDEAMDAASGISRERRRLFDEQVVASLLGDIVNYPMPQVGDALGVPDLGAGFRAPFHSDVPTLFLSGTLDGRTYPESARDIIKRFRNGHQLIVENGGHNLFEASPLIKDIVVDWFRARVPQPLLLTLPPPEFPL